MHNTKIIRPDSDINFIVNLIQQNQQALPFLLKSGSNFDMNLNSKPSVFLIEHGRVALYRKINDKLLLHISPPFPIGVLKSSSYSENYYMVCETDVKISVLNQDSFFSDIESKNRWISILNIVTYLIDISEENQKKSHSTASAYDIVRMCIHEIWALPENIKETTSVYDYILSRYNISRSSITKILKSLNDGGYISTKRAVLTKVNLLPAKY